MRKVGITTSAYTVNSRYLEHRLSRISRYLELKSIPLALVFQSFTIGYLDLLAISNCLSFPLSVRDSGSLLYKV